MADSVPTSLVVPTLQTKGKKQRTNSSNHITDEELGVKRRASSFNKNPFEFEKGAIEKHVDHQGLTSKQVEELLLVHGRNELVETVIPGWKIFLGKWVLPN